jgi:hypothetical protein
MGLHRARSGIGDGPWLCKRNHGGGRRMGEWETDRFTGRISSRRRTS